MKRQFIAYFFFVGWDCISVGFHVCLTAPNVEIHLPFGFLRIGWVERHSRAPINLSQVSSRTFGFSERYW